MICAKPSTTSPTGTPRGHSKSARNQLYRKGTHRYSRPQRTRSDKSNRLHPVFPLAAPNVDSLGLGVASSDVSATFGGLPHVERTLNWVRIAARFPVRILLDTPPDDLMRFGATAVIVIVK